MRKLSMALFFAMILTLFIPFSTVFADYTPPFEVSAEAVYFVNLDTGAVVYQKNADKKMYPASLTKLITIILAMENTPDLDDTMVKCTTKILDEFYGMNASNAGMLPGEERSMRDMLYCMLLPSANEAASMVADYLGDGSRADFIAMMNEKAEELGAVSTHFVNPHGLHDPEQYATAQDMYLIAKYAMQMPGFMDIASKTKYELVPSNKRGTEYINTTNKMMVQGSSTYYQYVKGIKTGTTDEAGRCCISTATKDGYTYLLVVMNAPQVDAAGEKYVDNMAFVDSKKLYEWAFGSFEVKELINAENPVTEIPLKLNWDKDFLYLRAESSFTALVPNTTGDGDVIQRLNIPKFINAPVKRGDVIGTVELMVMGEKIGSVRLLADENASRSEVLYVLEVLKASTKTVWFYIGIGAFVLLLIIMIIGSIMANRRKGPKFGKHSRY